jgi:hypothetical protein
MRDDPPNMQSIDARAVRRLRALGLAVACLAATSVAHAQVPGPGYPSGSVPGIETPPQPSIPSAPGNVQGGVMAPPTGGFNSGPVNSGTGVTGLPPRPGDVTPPAARGAPTDAPRTPAPAGAGTGDGRVGPGITGGPGGVVGGSADGRRPPSVGGGPGDVRDPSRPPGAVR